MNNELKHAESWNAYLAFDTLEHASDKKFLETTDEREISTQFQKHMQKRTIRRYKQTGVRF